MPLFSVITVCLNCKEKLEKTANSLLNQTFNNIEYIIKDGESSDGTEKIIQNVGADVVVSSPDNGVFNAMNQAIRIAKGEYVYFLNAGDVFIDRYVLEDVASVIKETSEEVDLFYGDVVKPYARRTHLFHPKKISRYYLYTKGLCHQAWFLSRKIYLKFGGFDTDHNVGGDYKFLLKIVLEGGIKLKHVNRFIAIYEGGGISSNPFLAKESEGRRKKERDKLYPQWESKLYTFIYKFESFIKKLIYDRFLYFVFNKWNLFRYKIRAK